MAKCPVCAASFPTTQFVCQYCGHVETERIKKIDADTVKEISFKDSMNVIRENLNALHEIKPPSAKGKLIAIARILVAIQTLGIALIFWRKPKKRFNLQAYNKLKAIVTRNIDLLKLSAKGSEQLQDRIQVAQLELAEIDRKIKDSMRTVKIVTAVVIIAYVALIFFPKGITDSDTTIIPEITKVEGNFSDKLEVIIEKYPVYSNFNKDSLIDELKIKIRFKVIGQHNFSTNEKLSVNMTLKDKQGNAFWNISVSDLDKNGIARLKKEIKHGAKWTTIPVQVKFYFIPDKPLRKLPFNLDKFSIRANLDTVEVK